MKAIELLASTSYLTVNKKLAKEIGLLPAIVLADLASWQEFYSKNGQLTTVKGIEGMFYRGVEEMENTTTLSDAQQRKAITSLVNQGLIEFVKAGQPQHRYFKIKESEILNILKFNS